MHKMKECMCLNKSPLQASMGNLDVILCCKVCVHEAVGPLSLLTHRHWEKENGWRTMYVWKSTMRRKLKCSLTTRRGRRLNHLNDSLSFSLRDFFLIKKCSQWFICGTTEIPFGHRLAKALGSKGEVDHLSFRHLGTCSHVRLLVCAQLSLNSILNFYEHGVFCVLNMCTVLCIFSV